MVSVQHNVGKGCFAIQHKTDVKKKVGLLDYGKNHNHDYFD